MKFDQLLRNFITSRRRGTSTANHPARTTTIKAYENDLGHLFEFLSKKPRKYTTWEQVTKSDISEFIDCTQKSGWAACTQYKCWRAIRALFFWMEDDEDCVGMKTFRKALPSIPTNPARIYVPPTEDIKKLASVFNKNTRSGLRDYTILMMLVDTGMRSGEIRYLKMEHLKLDNDFLMVPEEGKTGARPIWLTREIVTDIRRWLEVRGRFTDCDYVFVTDEGNPMGEYRIANVFSKARKRSGVKGLTAHTVRHYFCTNWIRQGGDIARLQAMTGHKQLSTLNIYLHLTQDVSVADELERINPRKGTKPDWRAGRERKKIS